MNIRFYYPLCVFLFLGGLVGCSEPQADAQKSVATTNPLSNVPMDETSECGAISYLFSVLPVQSTLESLAEVYRGCDSKLTAQLHYEGDQGSVIYSLAVLKPELVGLPADSVSWLEVASSNRQAMEELMAQQQTATNAMTLELPQEGEGVLFQDAGDWTFVALIGDGHALRIEVSGDNWEQLSVVDAAELMSRLLEPVQFHSL